MLASSIKEPGALLKIPEVAERLCTTPWRAYYLVRKGHLRAVKIGRAVRVSPRALEEFIEGGGTAASDDA